MPFETFKCSNLRRKSTMKTLFRALAALVFVCLSLTLIYNFQLIPVLIPFAKASISTEITKEMQNVIGECISSGSYSDFVNLTYNSEGNVTSLKTNSSSIAFACSNITKAAINNLADNNTIAVRIPLGTLSGGAVFAGKGPDIKIKVRVSPKVTVSAENEFYESGINQTLHRIVAKLNVKAYALLPLFPQEIDVATEYCIAETVIVGKVPDAYTKINRLDDDLLESDIDDIYDFGATLD